MNNGEKYLWRKLKKSKRHYNIHVRKQSPICPFVADFVIHEAKLIIELDGEHHFTPVGQMHEARRDTWLNAQGLQLYGFQTPILMN